MAFGEAWSLWNMWPFRGSRSLGVTFEGYILFSTLSSPHPTALPLVHHEVSSSAAYILPAANNGLLYQAQEQWSQVIMD
jgi:hypothetical protein